MVKDQLSFDFKCIRTMLPLFLATDPKNLRRLHSLMRARGKVIKPLGKQGVLAVRELLRMKGVDELPAG